MSSIYFDGKLKNYYVKRFNIETNTMNKKFLFISQEKGSKLEYASFKSGEVLSYKYFSNKKLNLSQIDLDNFIDVKGWKSIGNKIINDKIRSGTCAHVGCCGCKKHFHIGLIWKRDIAGCVTWNNSNIIFFSYLSFF